MDVETQRLEREEKRRQRRERIRRILEDDPTTSTREETDSSRTTRNTATPRRPRENLSASTNSERTRYRDQGDASEVSSVRSTRTSRLRENITATTPSTRTQSHTHEETTTRSTTTRRLREDRISTPTERTTTRSERTTRSTYTSEVSPTRNTQATRTSRQTADTKTVESSVDRVRARRDARRRRNLEHDEKQNKLTAGKRQADTGSKSDDTRERRRAARDKRTTENSDVKVDRQKNVDDSKMVAENGDIGHKQVGTDAGESVGGSSDLGRKNDSSLEESETQEKVDTIDKDVAEESQATIEEEVNGEVVLTEIETLNEHVTVEEHVAADKDHAEIQVKDSCSQEKQANGERQRSVEGDTADNSETTDLSVTVGDIREVVENDSAEVKEETVDTKCDENEESPKTGKIQTGDTGEDVEVTMITDEVPKIQKESEILNIPATDDQAEIVVEQKLETSPLEPVPNVLEDVSEDAKASEDDGSVDNGKSVPKEELVILEELPEIALVLGSDTGTNKSADETDEKESENHLTHDDVLIVSEKVTTQLESGVDGVPQGSDKEPDDVPPAKTEKQKTVSPQTSPRKNKYSTKPDETDRKSSERRTKGNVSRTKSDESDSRNERLRAKSDLSRSKSTEEETKKDEEETIENVSPAKSDLGRTKSAELTTKGTEGEAETFKVSTKSGVARTRSAESGMKDSEDGPRTSETGAKTSRASNLKVSDDDAWKKNVRKKRGVPDVDRAVELTVLGRTGKIKNKMKSCETRDVESAEQWKREVKKGPRKHKSFDEETEKELRELSSKRELKNVVQSCEEKDKESADAWKREVKKDARKHKSLDEDTENELREITKTRNLKDRIKECEKMDKESAETWKKEVKKESKPKDPDVEAGLSEDLKEFSGSGRIKDLISSCAERDENREKSWETAKQKVKSADDETELEELASITKAKSKIIEQYEEMEKQSAELGKKKLKSGEEAKSFDETTDEELKELAKTVDVKSRIQVTLEEQETPKEKQNDPLEDEELKEINLKGRLEMFKKESEKHAAENKDKKSASKTSKGETGKPTPSKAAIRKSPTKGRTSPTKGDSGRISPTKDRPRSSSGRESPSVSSTKDRSRILDDKSGHTGKDKVRTSSTTGDSSGRISPTKDRSRALDDKTNQTSKDKSRTSSTIADSSGRVSPAKDRSRTKGDSGRTSPTKDSTQTGRTSPTKRDTGRISPSRNETSITKRDTKGRVSPTKDHNTPAKSKLESIRANLMDGGKSKIKSKRESLDRITKTTSIKDKIAACKERDKSAPRTIVLPTTPAKSKTKSETNRNTPINVNGEADQNETPVPVNREVGQFITIVEEIQGASIKGALSFWKEPGAKNGSEAPDEEAVEVDIKGKMTYWESPKDGEDTTTGRDSPPKDSERPPPVILGNVKQGWQKRNRKLKVAEFIKELLSSNCKRRDLKDIQDVKSETKKFLAGGMHAEQNEPSDEKSDSKAEEGKPGKNKVELENKKNAKKDAGEINDKKADVEFSLDDVVNPDEVKQLRDFSNFRRQVRPTNRRAAKSNPVRKLQQRDDLTTGTENFNDLEIDDEEDAPLKPTAFGRLGRAIEPGDRKSKDVNKFAVDALAGLAAKEDVSKITLKKTSKSRTGVSQEKSEHDGTAPVMLLQIKGHRHIQTRLVEPKVESLNSADSFLLVTEKFLHVWNGKDSSVMKKSKASELSNKILQYKFLNCNANVVTIIKDGGVNVETGLTRTFWETLGGKKTVKGSKEIPKDGEYEKAVVSSNVVYSVDTGTEPAKLHKMSELCGKIPKIAMLDSDKAFVFDFGTEVYAWLGRTCDKTTRSKAVELALEVHKSPFEVHNSLNPITPNIPKDDDEPRQLKRPSWALFGRMTERAETILFEQKFLDWPDVSLKMKLDKEKDMLNKNLSKGYAKRIAKVEKSGYQAVELVPYDGAKMGEEAPPVKLILEGVNIGRGRGSYDEIERRSLSVTTNSVTVYHSSEKESRQLEEKEWGHFYSAESYVIRWSYSVKASGIRSLKGGESKRDTTGRDQIAYFFWHGRDCSASGKGTSALATIELDSDKSPQVMVDEGHESACFLNMFDGQMIVHHGKPDEAKAIDEDNVLMYCVHHEDEREICLTQIEARSSNLRSRSSFVVVVIDKAIGICVWHGAKSTKEKKQGALRGAKKLASWFQGVFEIDKVDMVEVDEGHEGNLFWTALDGKNDYGSLQDVTGKCENRVRLFTFLSTEGPFLAREIMNPTRGEHVSPYPFRQANLYEASQPALFLVDTVNEMYLWQGWWPGNTEESESATTTGSAELRWHRDRKLAMQSVQSYADSVGRQMSKAYVVNAGLEPIEFRALFPFWEDQPDVTKVNLESGKVDGKNESMTELLAKLSRDRYTMAELLVRPLPEGVDPLKMEMYLSDEEFKEVFNMTKDEFNKLPKWKKLEQRKKVGLF